MTRIQHNNQTYRKLLLAHLVGCVVCKSAPPPTHCAVGRVLWRLVGTTDVTPSPSYDQATGFRTDVGSNHVDVNPYRDRSSSNARPPLWRKRPQSTQERGKLTANSFGNQKHNL